MKTNLKNYDNSWYDPGRGVFCRTLWYYVNAIFFSSPLFPFSGLKCFLLRLFGAQVGKSVIIKPSVNIKYPWLLRIGDYAWIGESVWIDNLDLVCVGAHACLSQGALLLCGNHDYSKTTFDLKIGPIHIGAGAWIGAKSTVTANVTVGEHAVLSACAMATKDLQSYGIYAGVPAQLLKKRSIT